MPDRRALIFEPTEYFPDQITSSDRLQMPGGFVVAGAAGDMGSQKLTNLANGTAANDAVNYSQLQSLGGGLDPKGSCRTKTSAPASWASSGSGVGKTLTAPSNASSHNTQGGVLLAVDDRVMVDAESADVDNGIYTVTSLGNDVDTSFVLTRATDADENAEVTSGMYAFVTEGDDAGTAWFVSTADDITVDTTAFAWEQFAGPGSFTGSDGIDITSGAVSVDLATNSGLEFDGGSPNKLQVDADDGLQRTASGLAVDVSDFAGTGLEDDGAENLRLTAQGNGIAGGAGSVLSVDPDSESGGNLQPVSVGSNGVAVDVSAIAGTGLEADGSANLRLAAQGNGIAGGAGSTLSVQPDSTTGGNVIPVDVTANGVGLDVDDLDGDGLQADGSGRLGIELSASPGLQLSGTSPNKTLEAYPDGSTIQINGSGQLEVIGGAVTEAARVENTLTTSAAVAAGDPVRVSGGDTVAKADAASPTSNARVIGVARTADAIGGNDIEVVSIGECAGVLSTATPNTPYYLGSGGGLSTTVPSGNVRIIRVGYAISADDLWVDIQDFGRRAA